MTTNVSIPFFPEPPREYSQAHMAQLIKAFAVFAYQMRNPGQGRNTFTVFTNLQTDDVGLEQGSVYRHGNELRVSLVDMAAVRGVSATAQVGSVTVTTT